MRTPRHKPAPYRKGKCRWCSGPLPKGRTSWCSNLCRNEGWIRGSASFARQQVFKRDQGVCAECRIDTTALMKAMEVAEKQDESEAVRQCQVCETFIAEVTDQKFGREVHCGQFTRWIIPFTARDPIIAAAQQQGFRRRDLNARSLWEMDHIVPVIEGGGACGLDNLRTLCLPCHRRATAALAKRRAHARRLERKYER